jgi:hypothetical protein
MSKKNRLIYRNFLIKNFVFEGNLLKIDKIKRIEN